MDVELRVSHTHTSPSPFLPSVIKWPCNCNLMSVSFAIVSQNMVMAFRVTELQTLLRQFSKNKDGRKHELQARALELVTVNNSVIVGKIRELHTSML